MGHYASEMMGPYIGPTNEEIAEEKLSELQEDWDWQKKLFTQGHQKGSSTKDSYTCPFCFSLVNWWFLQHHDDAHNKQDENMRRSARRAALDTIY